eukprot:SAG11_NODE_22008_length_414_cov_0.787302_1_plen_46_part_01
MDNTHVPPSGASVRGTPFTAKSPAPDCNPSNTFVLPIGAAAGVNVF